MGTMLKPNAGSGSWTRSASKKRPRSNPGQGRSELAISRRALQRLAAVRAALGPRPLPFDAVSCFVLAQAVHADAVLHSMPARGLLVGNADVAAHSASRVWDTRAPRGFRGLAALRRHGLRALNHAPGSRQARGTWRRAI